MAAVPETGRGDGPVRNAASRSVFGLLGISTRAGAVVSGTQAVRSAVRAGDVHRVILALDAAAGQRAKLIPLLDARRIPYQIAFTQEELGAATGRAPISAVGISNPELARRVGELLALPSAPGDQQGGS